MDIYSSFINVTILAVVIMILGAWFLTFGSKMMRSNDLAGYRRALRLNVYATAVYWIFYVTAIIWPGMADFSLRMGAGVSLAIGLLLIFRYVKDVSVTKKVVIWFIWCALNICAVLAYTFFCCGGKFSCPLPK